MKRRLAPINRRKPVVQLDDVPKVNYGLGFNRENEFGNSQSEDVDSVDRHSDAMNAPGGAEAGKTIQFVKSESKSQEPVSDLDSKLNDFLKEINELDSKGPPPPGKESDKKEEKPGKPEPPKEPIPPTCAWHAVLDESSQYCYYWNSDTKQSTWEMPGEYSKYLEKYKRFEEEYNEFTKVRGLSQEKERKKVEEERKMADDKKSEAKEASPPLVPYDCVDESLDDVAHNVAGDEDVDECRDGVRDEDVEVETSRKRAGEDGDEEGGSCAKKMKLVGGFQFTLSAEEIQGCMNQIEEVGHLLRSTAEALDECESSFESIAGYSTDYIKASIQTRVEDWREGHLTTPYVVLKLHQWLEYINQFLAASKEKKPVDVGSLLTTDRDSRAAEVVLCHEVIQPPPPPPPPVECAPPPPPESDEPPTVPAAATKSLLPIDYGECSDDDENDTVGEASTDPTASRISSPLPVLETSISQAAVQEVPLETPTKTSSKMKSKKSKPLKTSNLAMRKKKVSMLVEKWQKVQEELDK